MTSLLNVWTKIKQWFNYSWSIFLARLEMLSGFLLGVVGGIDWDALANLSWGDAIYSKNNLIFAAILLIKGIVSEIGRRAGTVTAMNSQLVAANIADKAKIKVKE